MREVVYIDIANDPVKSGDYKATEDPSQYISEKTGRGPLKGKWIVSNGRFLPITHSAPLPFSLTAMCEASLAICRYYSYHAGAWCSDTIPSK